MDRRYCWAVFVAVLLACVISGCGGGSSSSSSSTTTPTGPLATNVTGLATGTVGTPYYAAFTESGGTPPYTWSQTSGGAMPGGLTFTSQGILTGTPTTGGNFGPYVFTVTDTTGATASTTSLSLTINALTLSVASASLPNGTVGAAYSFALAATGGSVPYAWSETSGGSLPPGLSLSSTGVISGTATAGGTYGPYVFTVTDTNSKTAASAGLSITINGTSASSCVPGGNEAVLSATPFAFLLKGSDANGNPIDIAGSFTPNGSGGLTNAAVDYNGFTNGHQQVQVNLAASSYAFSSDGQGCLSLSFSGLVVASQVSTKATVAVSALQVADKASVRMARPAVSASVVSNVQFSFVLPGSVQAGTLQSGRIIESDTATTGTYASGLLHAQTPSAFSLASLQPNFAFGADGWTTSSAPGVLRTAVAGTFVNTSGALSSGYADVNVNGTASGELTGGNGVLNSVDPSSGRGTGSFFLSNSLNKPQLTMDFVFYVLNGSDVLLLSTDTPQNNVTSPLLAGRALAANASYSSSALSGYYLLASQGLAVTASATGNFAQVGTLNATVTPLSATIYSNDAGVFTNTPYSTVGDAVEASGRVSFTGLTTTPPVAYLTVGSVADEGIAGFLVGTDAAASSGVLVFQAAGAPAYTDASVSGAYAASTGEDIDGANGAFLGLFTFSGADTYTVVSQVSGKVPNSPNLGTVTINADGSGSLDGGNYPLVTNGQTLFAIPDTGDPLLFVFTAGMP
jgi:large repetitive protein